MHTLMQIASAIHTPKLELGSKVSISSNICFSTCSHLFGVLLVILAYYGFVVVFYFCLCFGELGGLGDKS